MSVGVNGTILTVAVSPQIPESNPPLGGSYFKPPNSVEGSLVTTLNPNSPGAGAVVVPTVNGPNFYQRVIYTNQQHATLVYVREVFDPNVWDPLFQDAFVQALGADICIALSGDKGLANACIAKANAAITEARKSDGNEGLTINDITPDYIRGRGINWGDGMMTGPYGGFDWGGLLPSY
jgi:hypothetical protein